MKYKYGERRRAVEYEKALVEFWKKDGTFLKSVEGRSADNAYVFYDGPPFITGNPHHGTLLSSVVKDAVPRFWTMRGKRVERVWGWDCHGLPAENFVEKHLGGTVSRVAGDGPNELELKIGERVEGISLEKYIETAKELMVANSETWEGTIDRIGRWVDFKGAYKTMDKGFMESVWWAFKELYDKGLIYEGEKVLMYDTTFATPVSKNEVTMDNDAYRTVTDPSVYVKFKVKKPIKTSVAFYAIDEDGRFLAVRRNLDDESLPGMWGLPAATLKIGETLEDAVKKAAYEKFGVRVKNIELEGADEIDRGDYILKLSEFRITDFEGTFDLKEGKKFYAEMAWQDKPEILREAAENGSLCSRIFLNNRDIAFDGKADSGAIDCKRYLLAWTTTPWTLPGNMGLAVNPKIEYVEVELKTNNKVFLISGKHAYASRKFYPKLKKDLEGRGYEVTIIDHIDPVNPNYEENLKALEKYDFENANVVTHSLGASTFLSYLAKHNVKVNSLTMMAPSYPGRNVGSTHKEWLEKSGYVGFELDLPALRKKIAKQPVIAYSDNDVEGRRENAEELGEKLGAKMVLEPKKAHFFEEGQEFEPSYGFDFGGGRMVLILAKKLMDKVLVDEKGKPLEYEVIHDDIRGEDLVGLEYEGLLEGVEGKVYGAEFVEDEGGTGIVHIAPAYGEDDFGLGQREGLEVKHVIDDNGYYFPEVAAKLYKVMPWRDSSLPLEVWEANKDIAKGLLKAGKVWKVDYIQHEYPFNPRSGQRIMYRAIPSWFFDISGDRTVRRDTSSSDALLSRRMSNTASSAAPDSSSDARTEQSQKSIRQLMLEKNEGINWFPEYLKEGRFAKNIEQAPDWNLSRDRFWATAMPVWKGDRGTVKVVGSYDELYELSGVRLEDYHRPWVDEVEFEIEGEKFRRVDKVLDCWFESGSMPFAQLHYPFENKTRFEQNYPADFIVEYVGQVRAWFYYVHVINTALFGERAFTNVITTGTLAGNDGRKMSKSLGNYTDPNELMDKFSADALRFLMLSSPVLSGEDFALIDKDVSDTYRKLNMVWNMYDFFTMYAEVDGWEFSGERLRLKNLKNPLDIWIISRLHQLKVEITQNMENYNIPDALAGVLPFIDDASNWFVRRSRRRFWKSEDDADKDEAYITLYTVLEQLALVLAPFTPFLAEELWQNLVGGESVHLQDWPGGESVDQEVLNKMFRCREIIVEGLALRMNKSETEEQVKVRQPLSELKYGGEKLEEFYESIIAEEVNVKKVIHGGDKVLLNKKLTPELRDEGFARELIRFVQAARKKAGLNVDDRIRLSLSKQVPGGFEELVKQEVLASELGVGENYAYDEIIEVDGESLTISLEKI